MLKMFKIVFTLFLLIILITNISFANSSNKEKIFIITAYYSPLANQDSYITGSYRGDIKLNGNGKHTASGKPVFEGLLAGPKNYPFGTKIYFDGYGVGVIEDRGGAIVKKGVKGHEHDRIDIWMGYGDEGLQRAKIWGKKTIKGIIISNNSPNSIKFNESNSFLVSSIKITPESYEKEIKNFQKLFVNLGLYKGEIDGIYKSIEKDLINFQINNKIIKNKDDWGAGYFGDKTKSIIQKKFFNNSKQSPLSKEKSLLSLFKKENTLSEKYNLLLEYGDINIGPESTSKNIKKLQELFTKLGFYLGKIDGKYKSIEDSLISLQFKLGLIKDKKNWGAGYFGSKTKTALGIYLSKEVIKTDIILTHKEKEKIHKLGKKIKEKIGAIAKEKNKEEEKLVNNLIKKIDAIILKSKKEKLIVKLQYLKKVL